MNKFLILDEDLIINGVTYFVANKKYKVLSNGTSDVNREFILSDATGRGFSLYSLPCEYQVVVEQTNI